MNPASLLGRVTAPLLRTVKGRLIAMLLLSAIAPLALLGLISYSSFHSFIQNTLTKGIQENVDKELKGIDDILKNLNFASQQIALDQAIVAEIRKYMSTDDIILRKDMIRIVQDRMRLINYSSPHAGILTVLDMNRNVLFQSYPSVGSVELDAYPVLVEANGVSYHAPHLSVDQYGKESDPPVISLSRKVTDYAENGQSFYVYIESNFNSIKQLFGQQQYGEPAVHLLLDPGGRVVYSEDSAFPAGSAYVGDDKAPSAASHRSRMALTTVGDQGWQLVVLLDGASYRAEMDAWILKFATIGLFSLALSFLLAYLAWRSIFRPLQTFRKEIEWMGDSRIARARRVMNLTEFDSLLTRFYLMRDRVFDLLKEIEWRERARSRIEVEKLRYQINPHFIHNTLNTVQVIAKIHKQEEIVKLVTYFTRILHYNLGKEGTFVRVRDEIENLRDYLYLQQIRYNHTFTVDIRVEPEAENGELPRFVLQPLVENALYHGFRSDEGTIAVDIGKEEDGIRIVVSDNGVGMSEDAVAALFEEKPSLAAEGRKTGMGIGLAFTHRLIRTYYGDDRGLEIRSRSGEGTTITIRIPEKPLEGIEHDQNAAGR
ncbi:sensor histidine kinase [Cohnella sp. GCM10027633]|uniref:cache domain-containing sensor histidine kinase n=1 Tax=unclassified Cohnella TaxID=2636738 RepID=UPI00363579A0